MQFNKKLLEGIEDKDTAKVLLYFIKEEIPIQSYLTHHPSDSNVHWTSDYTGSIQPIVQLLEKNGAISPNYSDVVRYRVNYPLYVNNQEMGLEDEYVEECRYYFTYKYCKNRGRVPSFKVCKEILERFLAEYPEMKNDLPKVLKHRVDVMPDFIPLWSNFMNVNKDEKWNAKDVFAFYEDWKDSPNINIESGMDI